ncbi:MAG: hypothetical protein IPG07_11845 [Crocinitomicaceae bacterium]|nr:hypothetical protein [Crocinitomicaceae bacterium]
MEPLTLLRLKIYRDCNSTSPYDDLLPMTVFNGFGVEIFNFEIPIPTPVQLPVIFNNPCVSIPSGICVQEAIYTKTVILPPSPSGYTLSYQKCCRTGSTQNLIDPGEQGITLTIDIPPVADAVCNSSPRFDNYPPLLLCTDEPLLFDHSATDPDGDSLVYELCTPYQGGGTTLFPPNCGTCPSPNPALPPPYTGIQWAAGYSPTNPFGGWRYFYKLFYRIFISNTSSSWFFCRWSLCKRIPKWGFTFYQCARFYFSSNELFFST